MSQRVTRSSARLAIDSPSTISDTPPTTTASSTQSYRSTRKRKAAHPETPPPVNEPTTTRKSKRVKASIDIPPVPPPTPLDTTGSRRGTKANTAAMSSGGYDEGDEPRHATHNRRRSPNGGTSSDTSPPDVSIGTSKRRSSRKKAGHSTFDEKKPRSSSRSDPAHATTTPSAGSMGKRSRKSAGKKELGTSSTAPVDLEDEEGMHDDAKMGESDGRSEEEEARPQQQLRQEMEEDDDSFASNLLARMGGPSSLSSTLRALSGMMSGMTGRLRGILEQLRTKDDPSVQLIGLTELSEILLVSNEDNLAGHFAPEQYVKELVALMQPNDFGEENPEMMLLACRCIANMMEALPASTASVVYGGAVPVLCQKLLEIHFIDLAEQALSTLEKISVEFPSSIVREGGLTACLTYLDFFATSTQRTAVTTAANCCRNITEDSFPVVRDVMPILLNVLGSNDQRVVEQGSLCVSRIIESFKFQDSKLEELVSPELLKAMIRLLIPGSTNMISANIHTQFLRVLAIVARASPRLSVELLKMDVVDTLYQILTGVSPPEDSDNVATRIDKNVIMQALIRTPKDQIFETLNVICELLPTVSNDGLMYLDDLNDAGFTSSATISMATRSRTAPNTKRLELFQDCQDQVKRFALILFPTLMYAYTSTVNLQVREKVLTAQLKMLSNLDIGVVEDALRGVAFASHLASIISQQENPMLVTFAMQAAELLLKRLESIYRAQFYREGVIAEIDALAQRSVEEPEIEPQEEAAAQSGENAAMASEAVQADRGHEPGAHDQGMPNKDDERHTLGEADGEVNYDEDNELDHDDDEDDDGSDSPSSEPPTKSDAVTRLDVQHIITRRAQKFIAAYGGKESSDMAFEAVGVVDDLKVLAASLRDCYKSNDISAGLELFRRLASYFSGDGLQSITSHELLTSGIVDAMLEVLSSNISGASDEARSSFIEAFMSSTSNGKIVTGTVDSPATAFSVMVHKLQDLLSRTEHFEVITVHHNALESNRSSAASMLAKQLRLRLSADEDSGIPQQYRNIMVSIHAIATFRALDEYLRPRLSLADRPRTERKHGSMPGAGPLFAAEDRSATPSVPPFANDDAPQAADTKPEPSSVLPTAAEDAPATLRRSSKRLSQRTEDEEPVTPRNERADTTAAGETPLECADEAQISDEDEDAEAALDALVDGLEDEMDHDAPDPSAVEMEVANTGKVTARKEDGTRVATPKQGSQIDTTARSSPFARLAAAREALSSPSSFARHMSYATALQSVPQDWHIEFSVDGRALNNDMTIYRAVHFSQSNSEEVSSRFIWSALHKITFKRVPGPPPAESSSLTPPPDTPWTDVQGLPPSLNQHPQTASILQLLSILHSLNAHLDEIMTEKQSSVELNAEPLTQFVNPKLTAKLNRQMEEPLIVASNCLPSWSEDLARVYPFLFPFETRHLFLQSTSFGYSRSMTRWQNSQQDTAVRDSRHRDERPFLGRTQRQKVRISRSRILESALKVMELYGSSPSILEVEYFEEVGTGLGPTLEFYSTVSKEFSKKKIKLWRENESTKDGEFAFGKKGLFPAPMSEGQANSPNGARVLHLFQLLGKFVARSMLDSRIIDVSLNPTFFRIGDGRSAVAPSLGAVATVDQDLANSLKDLVQAVKQKRAIEQDSSISAADRERAIQAINLRGASISDLGLDFTLPGYPKIELIAQGAHTEVSIENLDQYVEKVIDLTLGCGVRKQIDAFRAGFSLVFPYSALQAFTPDELAILFGQADEDWSLETLIDSMKADHGFNLDSPSVRNLLQAMSEFTTAERRDFLQFVTGSPKLPIGGFKSLTPRFTVVCKPAEPPLTPDDYLPSVMTCVNYLKMPDYTSAEVLRAKLGVAIKEGQGAFHLS